MLCNALQGAVPELSFLAKPCQPNGHDDQMILVDPLRETSRIPLLLMGIHGMGSDHEPAHNYDHNYNHGPW